MRLKGGYRTKDRRLDRVPQFDPRSRLFPIRTQVAEKKPRSYTWSVNRWLDQGQEGQCVGFSWAHELAARPVRFSASDQKLASIIYHRAQQIDEWPGEDYSGTSVIAGAKAVSELGHISEYRWAFGINDLCLAVGYKGPAVLGINWYEGMLRPDTVGYITPSGSVVGGHAILCYRVDMKIEEASLWNSWGPDWGLNGTARIKLEHLDRLLREDGEACIPVKRIRQR